MEKYKKTLVVNELLASAQHAILTGKLTDEISETFNYFYNDADVHEARKILYAVVEKRLTTHKGDDAKKKDIADILSILRNKDQQVKITSFGVLDLSKCCRVFSAIGDEIQLRSEISELRIKFAELSTAFQDIKRMTTAIETMSTEIASPSTAASIKNMSVAFRSLQSGSNASNTVQIKRPTYLSVANEGTRRRHVTGASRPRTPVSPTISQKVAMQSEQKVEEEIHDFDNPDVNNDDKWQTARRRRPRPRQKIILGNAEDTGIRAADRRPREGLLFLSRVVAGTSAADVENMIKSKIHDYKLRDVETWNAKHNSYSSFKISFEIGEKSLKAFFNDIITADRWPAGVLIKPFGLKRMMYPLSQQL